ncbi:MAG: sigma-70 family RNA polymerase sigma factor [Clostridia bacterium]|nr:sigma-70 family RNA polymerase sigma factor [Clostridia bacterium]
MLRALFFRAGGPVLYINGADTLPPPLTAEEESVLLIRYCDDGERSSHGEIRDTLIARNLRLVVFISKKFENTGIGLEDLISIGTIGLIKAINTYRLDKNIKLATYASRCIENEILMYIRKMNPTRTEVSIDEPLNVDWDGNELLLSDILGSDEDTISASMEQDEDKKIIAEAISALDEREQLIISLRFGLVRSVKGADGSMMLLRGDGKEKTQKEVADLLGISQSYISRLEKKIIKELKSRIAGKL